MADSESGADGPTDRRRGGGQPTLAVDGASRADRRSDDVEDALTASIDQARRSRLRRRIVVRVCQVAVVVLVVGIWQALATTRAINVFFYGEPSSVWSTLVDWVEHGTQQGPIWTQIWTTVQETLFGFLTGVSLGVVCGITLGRIRFLGEVFGPYIKVANALPRIVLGSLFVVWFGLGIESKVWLSAVLVFFSVFFNAFQGAREVEGTLIANARVLGASRARVTLHVVVPSALSWIIASMHIAFGLALIGAIVGELLGAQHGLGLLVTQAQSNFDTNGVLAGMVIIAVVALLAEWLITVLERRLLRWRPPQAATDRGL